MRLSKVEMETVLVLVVIVEVTPSLVVATSTASHGELRCIGLEQQVEQHTDRNENGLAILRWSILITQSFPYFSTAMGQQIFDGRIFELRQLAIGKDLADVWVSLVDSTASLPIIVVMQLQFVLFVPGADVAVSNSSFGFRFMPS